MPISAFDIWETGKKKVKHDNIHAVNTLNAYLTLLFSNEDLKQTFPLDALNTWYNDAQLSQKVTANPLLYTNTGETFWTLAIDDCLAINDSHHWRTLKTMVELNVLNTQPFIEIINDYNQSKQTWLHMVCQKVTSYNHDNVYNFLNWIFQKYSQVINPFIASLDKKLPIELLPGQFPQIFNLLVKQQMHLGARLKVQYFSSLQSFPIYTQATKLIGQDDFSKVSNCLFAYADFPAEADLAANKTLDKKLADDQTYADFVFLLAFRLVQAMTTLSTVRQTFLQHQDVLVLFGRLCNIIKSHFNQMARANQLDNLFPLLEKQISLYQHHQAKTTIKGIFSSEDAQTIFERMLNILQNHKEALSRKKNAIDVINQPIVTQNTIKYTLCKVMGYALSVPGLLVSTLGMLAAMAFLIYAISNQTAAKKDFYSERNANKIPEWESLYDHMESAEHLVTIGFITLFAGLVVGMVGCVCCVIVVLATKTAELRVDNLESEILEDAAKSALEWELYKLTKALHKDGWKTNELNFEINTISDALTAIDQVIALIHDMQKDLSANDVSFMQDKSLQNSHRFFQKRLENQAQVTIAMSVNDDAQIPDEDTPLLSIV